MQVPAICHLRAVHHVRRSPQPTAIPEGKQGLQNTVVPPACNALRQALLLHPDLLSFASFAAPKLCSPTSTYCKAEEPSSNNPPVEHRKSSCKSDKAAGLQVVYGCANDRFGGCGSILSIHQTGCGGCGGWVHAAHIIACCCASMCNVHSMEEIAGLLRLQHTSWTGSSGG